jgi:uncharacterized protein involved in copper resistance
MPAEPAPPDPHAGHDMPEVSGGTQQHPRSEDGNPLVDMQTMAPMPRLDDPGIGLRENGRRVLTYGDLRSLFDDPDGREPSRTIEIHLTGHMQRFAWSFNGVKFSDAEPVRLKYGERVRIVLVNDTMMSHPIHLHGMWSDLEDDEGRFHVRKHTIDMPPGTRRSYRVTADALGLPLPPPLSHGSRDVPRSEGGGVRLAVLVIAAILAGGAGVNAQQQDHAGHAEHAEAAKQGDRQEPASGLPPITDADRAAAFPDVEGHTVHDRSLHVFVLFDQLEWRAVDGGGELNWDSKGWIGGDLNRVWFRSEGDATADRLAEAQAHVMYGRAIARWWDLVAGVRQDFRPGPGRTWAAIGIQGLAPYWFDVEATAYIGEGGRTHARFEIEYDLLFTNRLILQPLLEIDVYGKRDAERDIESGRGTVAAALRLRYEIRREVAPYLGVAWRRGSGVGGTRLAVGVRTWF